MRVTTGFALSRAAWGSLATALLVSNFFLGGNVRAESPVSQPTSAPTTQPSDIDARATLTRLASDELEGRGVGTAGLEKAADLIASDFKKLGLEPIAGLDGYFQPFTMTTSVKPDTGTSLSFGDTTYKLDEDFIPLVISGQAKFEGDAVFVGYGITNAKRDFDDYANLDVKGKVVIAMRFEPHDENGKSRFTKGDWSEDAHLARKAKVAAEHGAAALILVNPPTYHLGDVLMPFSAMGMGAEKGSIPVLQVTRKVADAWLQKSDKTVKQLQADIDGANKPASMALDGVKIGGNVLIRREEKQVKNVMAQIPGQGEHANQYLIIGSHYDHLGWGGFGSLAPGQRAIHHGADDNASGTVAMLKLADYFAHHRPTDKTLVFIAFTGEEEGLIGSQYFVSHPPIPLDAVTSMLNLDMVGRVRNNVIYVGGAGTAPSFDAFLKEANVDSPLVQKSFGRGGMGPSDHMSFALKKIPVIFLFSGMHMDYHRPTDTADKINYDGIDEVVKFSAKLVSGLEDMPKEKYVDAADKDSMMPLLAHAGSGAGAGGGGHTTLGIVPDYSTLDDSKSGVPISGTVNGSPAEQAGLKAGDAIVQWNADKVESLQQLSNLLSAAKPGDIVRLGVMRDGKKIELQATLAERKG